MYEWPIPDPSLPFFSNLYTTRLLLLIAENVIAYQNFFKTLKGNQSMFAAEANVCRYQNTNLAFFFLVGIKLTKLCSSRGLDVTSLIDGDGP